MVWEARPRWDRLSSRPETVVTHLHRMEDLLRRVAPPDSLAGLLPESPPPTTPTARQILSRAHDRAEDHLQVLAASAKVPAPSALEALRRTSSALAGLGAGFTPAGDDFLLGTIYAVWAMQPADAALTLATAVAEEAAQRTTKVSAAYLRQGAKGAAGEGWHRLVEALSDRDEVSLEGSLRDISRIGHTSGADALAGFLLGLGRLRPEIPA